MHREFQNEIGLKDEDLPGMVIDGIIEYYKFLGEIALFEFGGQAIGGFLGLGKKTLKASKFSNKIDDLTELATATADKALKNGKQSGAATALEVDGQIFTAHSGEVIAPNKELTGVLMGTPKGSRAPWHGGCSEVGCVDKALNSGITKPQLQGANTKTVNIGVSGKGHGTPKPACPSCEDMLNYFGIKF